MSDFFALRDHIAIQKGKAPLATGYLGKGAEPYLNPEYLRGRAQADLDGECARQAVDDREAEAQPLALFACRIADLIELGKDFCLVLGGDAGTVVAHFDQQLPVAPMVSLL